MEKQLSTLRDEFTRCTRRSERQHLVLSDLLTFSHSLPVRDLSHIAVVWCLDRTHSGRISMADLLALGEALLTRSRQFQSFEREAQLQARRHIKAIMLPCCGLRCCECEETSFCRCLLPPMRLLPNCA